MRNLKISLSFLAVCLLAAAVAHAQVLAPPEVKDQDARVLQQKYLPQLKAAAADMKAHQFAYPFYFSRALDLEQQDQQRADQRSIRFEKYKGEMVLEITGNYYAAYSSELMNRNQRARQTLADVVTPLLKAAETHFANVEGFTGYAFEISHHVRNKILGVQTESAENVMMLFPRAVAERYVAARTPEQAQEAVQEAEVYLDSAPLAIWLHGKPPSDWDNSVASAAARRYAAHPAGQGSAQETPAVASAPAERAVAKLVEQIHPEPQPARVVTPETVAALQTAHQAALDRLVKETDAQAHYVSYAPPSFVSFHQGAYLQLSITTTVQSTGGSRYKLASLAFDDHIAHLVRPVLGYFNQSPGFDGIDFSTSVKAADGSASNLAIEFFLPVSALRCFAAYDCTGQQLINSGIVLINGERAAVDLQVAEGTK